MGLSRLKCSLCKVRVVRTKIRRVESMQGLATCWYHGYPYSPSFITIGNVHEESIGHRVGGNRSSGFRRWVFPEAMREDEMCRHCSVSTSPNMGCRLNG